MILDDERLWLVDWEYAGAGAAARRPRQPLVNGLMSEAPAAKP